ncbi:MAG: NlpC/P60 family protein [Actinomycetes bacterium]
MKFSLRRYVVLVTMAGLVLASTAALAPTSSADPLADKRVEAERISQQLSALDTKMELLGEDYNQAQVALDDVQVDSDAAAVRVDAADAALAVLRARLADMAVEAYMRGGQSDLPEILLKGSGPTVSRQIEYLQAASANQRQLIDDVAVAQQQADIELAALQADRDRAQSLRDQLAQKKSETEQASATQQALLSRVTGELGTLVAQAAARQARADELAARAQLASTPAPTSTVPDRPGTPSVTTSTTTPGSPPGSNPTTTAPPGTIPEPVIPPGPPPPLLAGAARAVALAETQLGVPYLWGGANPTDGFDCSGLLVWAWKGVGTYIPHSSQLMYKVTRHIALSDLQPGDFVFYGAPIHHVGMYVGGGRMIEAPHTGAVVRYASIYRAELVGAGRVV